MANQICPTNGPWLVNAFTDATSKQYGYLVLDHYPSPPENQAVATNILLSAQFTYYMNSHLKVRRH